MKICNTKICPGICILILTYPVSAILPAPADHHVPQPPPIPYPSFSPFSRAACLILMFFIHLHPVQPHYSSIAINSYERRDINTQQPPPIPPKLVILIKATQCLMLPSIFRPETEPTTWIFFYQIWKELSWWYEVRRIR